MACQPTAVTILIGTNDVRDGVPLDQYRDNLGAIVDRIKSDTTARIALMSLPPLGEDLDAGINVKLSDYNAVIEETAARTEVDYLPVHERMADTLRQRDGDPAAYDFNFLVAFGAGARHYLFGQSWDEIAHNRGHELLVDHIHLSDQGGAIIADLTAEWLTSPPDS